MVDGRNDELSAEKEKGGVDVVLTGNSSRLSNPPMTSVLDKCAEGSGGEAEKDGLADMVFGRTPTSAAESAIVSPTQRSGQEQDMDGKMAEISDTPSPTNSASGAPSVHVGASSVHGVASGAPSVHVRATIAHGVERPDNRPDGAKETPPQKDSESPCGSQSRTSTVGKGSCMTEHVESPNMDDVVSQSYQATPYMAKNGDGSETEGWQAKSTNDNLIRNDVEEEKAASPRAMANHKGGGSTAKSEKNELKVIKKVDPGTDHAGDMSSQNLSDRD